MMHPEAGLLVAVEEMRRDEISREIARGRLIRQARRDARAAPYPKETVWRHAPAWWAALLGALGASTPRASAFAAPRAHAHGNCDVATAGDRPGDPP